MTHPADDYHNPGNARTDPAGEFPVGSIGDAAATADVNALDYATVPNAPHAQSLTRQTRDGAIWSVGGMVLMQGSTVAAHIIVGNLLSTEYALNMMIVTVTMVAALLRDAGIRKIAIASGTERFPLVARQLQQLTWILNLAVTLLLLAITPLLWRYAFDTPQPRLAPMLWILAAAFAISPYGSMGWAKLAIDLQFRTIALLTLGSYIVRNGSLIVLALLGFKELALVLPTLFSVIFEAIGARLCAGPIPRGPRLTWRTAIDTLMTSRWVMLAILGTILATRSDSFFVARVGGFDFATTVTDYGFALTLMAAALTPFTHVLQITLTPVFVRLADDAERLGNAFLRVLGVASVIGSGAWLPGILLSAPTLHLIFRGKWDDATPIFIALLCTLIPKSLQAAALALDESRGWFKRVAILVAIDGSTTALFAFAGAWGGNPVWLAAAITAHHAIFCVCHVLYVSRRACAHDPHAFGHVVNRIFAPALLAMIALGSTLAALRLLGFGWWPGMHPVGFAAAPIAFGFYVGLVRFLQPNLFRMTLNLLLRRGDAAQ